MGSCPRTEVSHTSINERALTCPVESNCSVPSETSSTGEYKYVPTKNLQCSGWGTTLDMGDVVDEHCLTTTTFSPQCFMHNLIC